MGPNEKKLITMKMSKIMIPDGGGVLDGFNALTNPTRLGEIAKEATEWVKQAMEVVKSASDNPYGDDNEAIAAEVLRRIECLK
jgi:hypothetical protein